MERKLSQMEKIIFTLCLVFTFNLNAQTCIIDLDKKNISLKPKTKYTHSILTIHNTYKKYDSCSISGENVLYIAIKKNKKIKKPFYHYTLQDLFSCKIPDSYSCILTFKIKNKYYEFLDFVISEPDLAPPMPK